MRPEYYSLLSALLLGAANGLMYDIMRALRYKSERCGTAADLLFTIFAGLTIFIYSITHCEGQVLSWQIMLIPAGFVLYMLTVSRIIIPVITYLLEIFIRINKKLIKELKFLLNSAKNLFKNMR